ncbi:UDP-N-acetylmuramate dehydrogenase [Coriobacterium glomerans PW2]|uniref:UDP-N-acetylenolpyruvoylglucosamine reductase n=1 Tax=Coriobacterium glomerans (strain ATCC 49209 / DSM 20642 / JCM 10262 / PW2) TaxID=700015 RepID=F2NAF1_CORGP|nr:UDP-N-acetylmuramate dehydrogenase [Coriobacterium glomerans]AEB06337.1 UDP-N-acetylmuramate dehydrogenase [Coriobacterium glomerans PW2]
MHEHGRIGEDVICALAGAAGDDNVVLAEPMAKHTTFRIGGPADVMVSPRSIDACAASLDVCAQAGIPVLIVGNGSNLLVGDRGIRGVVIRMRENLDAISVDDTRIRAEAGALLSDVARVAESESLTGFEPISGIPATVGGACFMNAGAYGSSTGEVLESVTAYVPGDSGNRGLDPDSRKRGSVVEIARADLELDYRSSRVSREGLIVLAATFALDRGESAAIRAAMRDFRMQRERKQPLDVPSAGSTFRRPPGRFAGKLIMDAGLRGTCVGGARVSDKHCGFVVNADRATAADVCALMALVQKRVKRSFGVDLEPEIRRVGEF